MITQVFLSMNSIYAKSVTKTRAHFISRTALACQQKCDVNETTSFVSALGTCFAFYYIFLLQRLVSQSPELLEIRRSHCEILEHANVSFVTFLERFMSRFREIGIIFGPGRMKKIYHDIFQSPHSPYKWVCPKKQHSCQPWVWSLRENVGIWKKWLFLGKGRYGKTLVSLVLAYTFLFWSFSCDVSIFSHCHVIIPYVVIVTSEIFFW